MNRNPIATAAVLLVLLASGAGAQPFSVEPADDWTALMDTESGWTGGDGIYSIPLHGDETPGNGDSGHTVWVFSDSFVGEVGPNGERLPGTVMINNAMAWTPPTQPGAGPVFHWYRTIDDEPASVFVPDTPNSQPGDYYWPGDGIVIGNALYFLAGMVYNADNWFHQRGVAMLRVPLSSRPPTLPYQQWDVPLRLPETDDRGAIHFTGGIFPNTARAGAPNPDGYVYIYGLEEVWLNKYLLVARVPEMQFPYVAQWEFFDGEGWSADIADAARLCERVSPENSVTPLNDGRYLLVFILDTITRHVAVRVGETPWGPWGDFQIIWSAPEPDLWPDETVWCYNAKAHPHLSEPGSLLISYNLNVEDFWAHFEYADIYRPRFIRLTSPLLP